MNEQDWSSEWNKDHAHVGDTVTLKGEHTQPVQWIDEHHSLRFLEGWTVSMIKVDSEQRPSQIFLDKEGVPYSVCISGSVAKDGTLCLYLRGAS